MPISEGELHFYCLFCRSGSEMQLAHELERRFPPLHTLVAIQQKHKIIKTRRDIAQHLFLPGYLFLYSTQPVRFDEIRRLARIYRVLGEINGTYELSGSDRVFAQWLWHNDGIIGVSKIRLENGELTVRSGPMQYFFEDILKLDKHTRNALVRMNFLGKKSEIWLAFEFDDEMGNVEDSEYEQLEAETDIAHTDRGDAAWEHGHTQPGGSLADAGAGCGNTSADGESDG